MMPRLSVLIVSFLLMPCLLLPEQVLAFSLKNPEQTGISIMIGSSYDPRPTFGFFQLSLMALYDYEEIMPHQAPEPLRFKWEGSFGLADISSTRFLASINFFALYYLRKFETTFWRPYIEGGAGLVYSDFRVEGQGLRINFNPQAGIGIEWKTSTGTNFYSAIRAYHLSNSELYDDNRGINAVTLMVGVLFN